MAEAIKQKIGTIILNNGKILLIKEKYASGSRHLWNCGTGSYEESDGEIENAAIREAREEMGIDIKIEGLFRQVNTEKPGYYPKCYYFFVASANTAQINIPQAEDQKKFNEDIVSYGWFSGEEILDMADTEFVTNTIARIIKEYVHNPKISVDKVIENFPDEIAN